MKRLFLSLVPVIIAAGGAHGATLPDVSELSGQAHVEIEGSHSAAEIYNHFFSECAGAGKPMFLAPVRDGRFLRLTLLSQTDAAAYIEAQGDGKYPWLLACQGAENFLVEKDHSYGTGGLKFRLHKGRSLEGIDYVEKRPSAAVAAPSVFEEEAFAEKMASDLSFHGMDFVATKEGTRFEARLEGRQGQCDSVSVILLRAGTEPATKLGFKVCSGRVYPSGNSLAMKKG